MKKENAKRKLRETLIGVALVLIGYFMPALGPITKTGMLVIGAFAAVLWGFLKNIGGWYALIIIMLHSILTGASITNTVIPAVLGNGTLWMVIFVFWFAAGLQNSGLLNYIASKILRIKFAQKGPYALMFVFFAATWISSAVSQAVVAPLILMLGVLKSVSQELGLEEDNKWTLMTAIGCAVCNVLGYIALPFAATPLYVFALMQATMGITVTPSYVGYITMITATSILTMIAVVLVTKYLIRPKVDMSGIGNVKALTMDVKLTKPMKLAILALVIIALMLMIPSFLPADMWIVTFLNNFGVCGAFGIAMIIMCFAWDENGNPAFDFGAKCASAASWDMLLPFAAVSYIGLMLNSADTGISAGLAALAQPLAGLHPLLLIAILCVFMVVLTNVMNNFITIMVFAPVGFAVVGYDTPYAQLLVVMAMIAANLALAFPSGSTAAMVLHGEYKPGQVVKYAYPLCILGTLLGIVCMLLLKGMFV